MSSWNFSSKVILEFYSEISQSVITGILKYESGVMKKTRCLLPTAYGLFPEESALHSWASSMNGLSCRFNKKCLVIHLQEWASLFAVVGVLLSYSGSLGSSQKLAGILKSHNKQFLADALARAWSK